MDDSLLAKILMVLIYRAPEDIVTITDSDFETVVDGVNELSIRVTKEGADDALKLTLKRED